MLQEKSASRHRRSNNLSFRSLCHPASASVLRAFLFAWIYMLRSLASAHYAAHTSLLIRNLFAQRCRQHVDFEIFSPQRSSIGRYRPAFIEAFNFAFSAYAGHCFEFFMGYEVTRRIEYLSTEKGNGEIFRGVK